MELPELVVHGERVTIPVPCPVPVQRGTLDVCLSTARGGPPVHSTLARVLVVEGGRVPDLTLFARDVRAMWPRGGRAWLVVRYGGQLVATGAVAVLVP
jgi:hypothetical protein